jgi:hypothetical protein
VFKNYTYVQILYKNQFLINLYSNVLSRIGVTIVFKNITYSSSDSQNYVDIEKEKGFLTSKDYVNDNILANYIYKLYYYQRIHPVVELKVFFGYLDIDKVLINYRNYPALSNANDVFYNKVGYYFLPLFINNQRKKAIFQDVYKRKLLFFLSNYVYRLIKILKFSYGSKSGFKSNLLVAARKKESFIHDTFYDFDKSNLDYISIDPITLKVYSKKSNNSQHLFSISPRNFFKIIFGIYRLYKDYSTKKSMDIALRLYLLENVKTVYFLKKLIAEQDIKVIYTCYEGAPIINILNILGYESDNVISLSSTWSLGMVPQFVYQLYKSCDIFLPWGEWHKSLYIGCESPFKSMIMVGYIGDYAIETMKKNIDTAVNNLKKNGYKIVTVYDNKVSIDSYITQNHLDNFYRGVLQLLKEGSYAFVIKSKEDFSNYVDKQIADDILSYRDRVIFNYEKVNLSPAFNSDFVYSFHRNTLGCLASIWGKRVILYDEGGFISEDEFLNCSIINSVNELLTCVKQLDLNSLQIDRGSSIDPFVDGRAQNRITEYVQLLLSSNENSKSSMIRSSNSIYKKRYGKDKVFEKKDF